MACAVSRAPLAKLQAYKRRMGWTFRWDGAAKGAAMTGTDVATYTRERPGMSAFVLENGVVYHTYSAYARGLDGLWGAYQWLDRASKGATSRTSGGAATMNTQTKARARVEARSHTCGFVRWPYPQIYDLIVAIRTLELVVSRSRRT